MLTNKNIILGVTGGIAAYKAANLTRLLIKEGAHVKIIMTPMAKEFITPLTLATLSKNPILVDFYNPENGDWNSHVDLGIWADAFIIAPATANTLAKMANGIADNLLLTTYLSARCPVYLAPAMDLDMYQHVATQRNLNALKELGHTVIEPESGELASGLVGKGRMAEPEAILEALKENLKRKVRFAGKKVLITAGPTHEAIDPVRFIGNHSSGKMGFALADAFAREGAEVTIIAGPVAIHSQQKSVKRVDVVSAIEMYEQCHRYYKESDIIIMAAAVADYRPESVSKVKLKKEEGAIDHIRLVENPDILASLGEVKQPSQILVGFALETHNELANAKAKLERKHLDLIVLNSMLDSGAGFKGDTNKITVLTRKGNEIPFVLKQKSEVANDILEVIFNYQINA